MAKQALVWTAIPNGYTADGKSLRVSLLASPRLDAEIDPQQLSTFPDFKDWPATLASTKFVLHYGAASVAIPGSDTTSANHVGDQFGIADSSVWKALFPDTTFVRSYNFEDHSNNQILSYQAAKMDTLVSKLYTKLAASAQDQLPTATTILGDPDWDALVNAVMLNDRLFLNSKFGLRDPARQFDAFSKERFGQLSGLSKDLALFQLFHTPPSTPQIEKYPVPPDDPKARARWLTYKRTALPKPGDFQKDIEFHQIVAAMNQYPTLLRRLGLVVDLVIAKSALSPSPDALLWAEVQLPPLSPQVKHAADGSPRTRALLDANRFQALPRPNPQPGDYRMVDRLLDLDPKQFFLLQSDVDGAGLKVMNFARTLARLKQAPVQRLDPTSKHERDMGAPALRNAGLMLVHDNRWSMLKNNFSRQKLFNTAAETLQNGGAAKPPILSAEDLVRGYRIDIWDRTTGRWRSLCQREADYDINSGKVVINVGEEEGTVRLAATKSPDPASNQNVVWLHEALVSWTGWSLCARQPGKTIHHHRDADPTKDHVDEVGDAEPEVPPGLRLSTEFRVLKGSLPRLRYGRRYWIRARVVDLAGNSLPVSPKDFGPENPANNARPYLRYHPITAPAIALVKPTPATVEAPAEGESMERMAIRTFNDVPAQNTVPAVQHSSRFAVADRTTHKEAELHGMLDRNGKIDPTFFPMLAAKDNSLTEEKILSTGPLSDTGPVKTGYAVMEEGQALPYLPDPLAIEVAARIFDHPGFDPNKIIPIPLYTTGTGWPEAAPFKIELYEKPGDSPQFDEGQRTLFIPLPKAERATLRLSVKPTKEALQLLGVWNWLTPAKRTVLEKMALNGQHWMLTPWRNIELVHATQKPLITPEVMKIVVNRPLRATFALPNFVSPCSIKSTNHLDLLAQWNEPLEDVKKNSGENRARTDHAFAIKITDAKSYAGNAEYQLAGKDLIRAGGLFHDLIEKRVHEFNDTRYRRIEYWLDATTKFREFMPANVLTELVNGTPEPTDKNIKVTGPKARTWIPSSAPPPAPEVLYVVPTYGWVRSSDQTKKTSWRRGGGLRVYLNRPWNASGYGEMLGVVLPSASFADDPMTDPSSQPLKNFVTQWGNDPIWLSSFVAGASPKRSNFPLARAAADPSGKWLPAFAPPDEADQPPGLFATTGLQHPEMRNPFDAQSQVEVAPHDVFYDDERQLWYCDIEVTWGAAYYPFIRLALARYQPVSVPGAHLSNIVLSDFMALAPDRWLNVTHTRDPRIRQVNVYGFTYRDSSSHTEAKNAPAMSIRLPDGSVRTLQAPDVAPASVVEVWVERLNPALGEDFGWQRVASAIIHPSSAKPMKSAPANKKQRAQAKQLLGERRFVDIIRADLIGGIILTPVLWQGSVTLPEVPGGATRYRLAIAEYEEYLVDDASPYDLIPTKKDRRLVFLEYVELD
jgi:hypothetical protein